MAKISVLPDRATIDMLKGTIDYYAYLGIPCVRKWPVLHITRRTAAVRAMWPFFRYINQIASSLPHYIQDQWKAMARGTDLTWKDMLNRAYLGHTYNPPGFPRTFPAPSRPERFVITAWTTTQDPNYVYLDLTTDIPCRLWLARLEDFPLKREHTRYRRGYDEYLDRWWTYEAKAWESPGDYPDSTDHHFKLNKAWPYYYRGLFFHATIEDSSLSALSQYFSPQDLGLA